MDMLSDLRELAFATRLKRLSERLMRDVSRVYKELAVDFEPRWFSIVYTLSENNSMTVTSLARSLRLTHPAVNQLAAELMDAGLLISSKSKKDERKRLLRLSAKGRKTADALSPAWELIRICTADLIREGGVDMLAALDRIEDRLDMQNMFERVQIKKQGSLDIVDYKPSWKKHFRTLTCEWLDHYFSVEEDDEAVISDPKGRILDAGGAIIFARLDSRFVGTCALMRHNGTCFELAKMAVTPKARGMGIGRRLAMEVMERARSLDAETLYLQTSPKLEVANLLYKKLGFKKVSKHPLDSARYQRCTIVMKKEL